MRIPTALRDTYRSTALILLNTLILLLVANVALFVYFEVSHRYANSNVVFEKYGAAWVTSRYPELSREQVQALLEETWSLHLTYEPYTEFRERPFQGAWVTVDPRGFRVSRNQGPYPPSGEYFNVFVFGGSTTFGYGLPNDFTIPSYVQELLPSPKPARVYNWGRGFYFSSQERILSEALLVSGIVPDLAIFIDGLNEFYYADDRPRLSSRLELFVEGWELVKTIPMIRLMLPLGADVSAGSISETTRLVAEIRSQENGEYLKNRYTDPGLAGRILDRYRRNKTLIENAFKAHNVPVIFVWQPIPDQTSFAALGYPQMANLYREGALGPRFVWCADVPDPVYVDSVHYSAETSRKIAQCIVNNIVEADLLLTARR